VWVQYIVTVGVMHGYTTHSPATSRGQSEQVGADVHSSHIGQLAQVGQVTGSGQVTVGGQVGGGTVGQAVGSKPEKWKLEILNFDS